MPEEIDWRQELLRTVEALGFSYEVTMEDVDNFIKFCADYEPVPARMKLDEDLLTASELMTRWGCPPKDLFRNLSSLLPIYLFHKPSQRLVMSNDLIRSAMDTLQSSPEPYSWMPSRQETKANVSFAFPWFWLISSRELQFLERLPRKTGRVWPPPLIPNHNLEPSPEWITWNELLERWNIKNRRLEDFILDFGLNAYWLNVFSGIETAPENIILKRGQGGDWFPREQNVLFARRDVWDFEEKYGSGKYRKGKHPQMMLRVNPGKLRAIDLIQEALRIMPEMTTTEVTPYLREIAPLMFGPAYPTDRTIKDYVKDLPLKIREGRPRKTGPKH